jgi:hypothetical protein
MTKIDPNVGFKIGFFHAYKVLPATIEASLVFTSRKLIDELKNLS